MITEHLSLTEEAMKLVDLFPYCTWCRKLYKSTKALKAHSARVHGNQSPYYDLVSHLYNALEEADRKKQEWPKVCAELQRRQQAIKEPFQG